MTNSADRPEQTARFAAFPNFRGSRRTGVGRTRDRGTAIIEFALAFPILILLMMGVIDFGLNYSNKVQTTHAAREGARAGSVGRVGTDNSCFTAGIPTDLRTGKLICLIKSRTHMAPADVRVRISYMDANGAYTNDFSETARQQNKYSIMVCISTRAYSLSGLLAPVFRGRHHHSRAVIKTGATPWSEVAANGGTVYAYVSPFTEAPFVDGTVTDSWAWCTSDDPSNDPSP